MALGLLFYSNIVNGIFIYTAVYNAYILIKLHKTNAFYCITNKNLACCCSL